MTIHNQVSLHGVYVDELMAPILETLWDAGITTNYSCQGTNNRNGYIAYKSECFLEIIEFLPYLIKSPLFWYCSDMIHDRPAGEQWAVNFPSLSRRL